jgi:hypothetical protein
MPSRFFYVAQSHPQIYHSHSLHILSHPLYLTLFYPHLRICHSTVLYQEIDYTQEGRNACLFAENFKDTPWVKVPEVYWEHCAPQVLTMEYVPGIKINRGEELEKAGLDKNKLARLAVECYLVRFLSTGSLFQGVVLVSLRDSRATNPA